ncbi:hypothetical protein BKA57DRAFT_445640 [Linnemannia elongata]|nr:hypothetical protein BKA57DRAFT_445640 [Linnemannia elongata]
MLMLRSGVSLFIFYSEPVSSFCTYIHNQHTNTGQRCCFRYPFLFSLCYCGIGIAHVDGCLDSASSLFLSLLKAPGEQGASSQTSHEQGISQ